MASTTIETLPTWLTFFICAAPMVIGMRLGVWLSHLQKDASWALSVMACGIGGVSGYLLMAATIYLLDITYLQAFTPSLIFGVTGLATLIVIQLPIIWFSSKNRLECNTVRLPNFSALLLLPSLLLLASSLYISMWEPVSGWDSLEWFVRNSAHFIKQETQTRNNPSPFTYPNNDSYIHPITTTLIGGFSGWVASMNATNFGAMLPWQLTWVCLALITFGFVTQNCENVNMGVLSAFITLSLPLMENHSLIAGYTELWLSAIALSSAALLATALILDSKFYLILGILFSFIIFSVKSSGFIYGMCLLAALFLAYWWHKSKFVLSALVLTAFSAVWLTYSVGFHFELFGYAFSVEHDVISSSSYLPGEMLNRYSFVEHVGSGTRVSLAGRTWTPTIAPLSSVLENEFYALLINASFSSTFLCLIIVASGSISTLASADSRLNPSIAGTFLIICTIFVCMSMMLAQFVFDYAFDAAMPDSDTGNSRFTLPAAILAILAIFSLSTSKTVAPGRSSLI